MHGVILSITYILLGPQTTKIADNGPSNLPTKSKGTYYNSVFLKCLAAGYLEMQLKQ